MFWGLIMEPQRRYSQKVKTPFHISMASLDVSASTTDVTQVICGVDGRNYLLCTLRNPDLLQCSLDLNFEVGDVLSLATNGKCNVHLTGYLIDDGANDSLYGLGEDAEEAMAEKEIEKKNKKRNKQQRIDEPRAKKIKQEQDEESEDDSSDIDVKSLLENSFDSDEDDDTFNSDNEEEEGEDEAGEEEEDENELEDEEDSSLSEDDGEEETVQRQKTHTVKMNGTPKKQEQQTPKPPKEKKKKKKKNQQQQESKGDKNVSIKENQSPKKDSPKKIHQNGLIIEDLKEGQGQPAKAGKFVTVYYEGRLKTTNKVFDSTKQGQGFSFRLGAGEVIKGWDSGLVGMKIGGKRRITCPPQMAYGAKGSPPAIPGNSTLVFEVELRKVR